MDFEEFVALLAKKATGKNKTAWQLWRAKLPTLGALTKGRRSSYGAKASETTRQRRRRVPQKADNNRTTEDVLLS